MHHRNAESKASRETNQKQQQRDDQNAVVAASLWLASSARILVPSPIFQSEVFESNTMQKRSGVASMLKQPEMT